MAIQSFSCRSVAMEQKSYGLILKKNTTKPISVSNSFFEGKEDEEQTTSKSVSKPTEKVKKQTLKQLEKALCEDPTVFEYDSVYDDFKNKKTEAKTDEKTAKSARYIPTLLHTADSRKKEQERRLERRIQKEREAEGDEFKDKEAFVTTAYKEKLLEMEVEKEKELKEQKLEEMLDVKKQKDLSGFYRHLLHQTIDTNKSDKTESSSEKLTFSAKKINRHLRTRERSPSSSSDSSADQEQEQVRVAVKTHLRENYDEESEDDSVQMTEEKLKTAEKVVKKDEMKENTKICDQLPTEDIVLSGAENTVNTEQMVKPNPPDKKALLLQLFAKRTVGEVFEDKKNRYLLRKQQRMTS